MEADASVIMVSISVGMFFRRYQGKVPNGTMSNKKKQAENAFKKK